ncbi:hypothetical protein CEXT_14461 [Caerostris extrusa]|uniref:Uncharacterized protein n=1 Tax=Caerostris extrusa TaxID=172846 RepID=A0AAV4NJW9_CAEEX|nr:hypothetical protein CEXT_14461 [Caerostris extrusa]
MANRRSPNSLFELCIKETSNHLADGRWNREDTNPFSQISCIIVNELFKFLIKKNLENPNPLELLLKSGQLQISSLMELISQKNSGGLS